MHDNRPPFPECQTEHVNKQTGSFRESFSFSLELETALAQTIEEAHTILTPRIIQNPHRPSLFCSDFDNFDQLVNDISGASSIHTCHGIMLQNIPSESAADDNMTDNQAESLLSLPRIGHAL